LSTIRPRAKRWERRSGERPAELLNAALALFAERGFARTRLDDVAARCGVSKATVYLYYANKEQLFEAVVREAVLPNIERLEAFAATYDGTTPNLIRSLVVVFEGLLAGPLPALVKVILTESSEHPTLARMWSEQVIARGFASARRIIQRGIDRGEFREVNAADMVPVLVAPVLLLAMWKQAFDAADSGVRFDRRAVLTAHVENMLRGLAVHPEPPGDPAAPR
jgi:AcrR family transcriptional regulator